MSFPGPELPTMQADMSALVNDWGVTCTIKRKSSSSRNAAGQVSVAFSTVGTDTLWIQPWTTRGLREAGIKDMGIIDKSTHQAFQHYAGPEVITEDQISAQGETYPYDVLSSQVLKTHRLLYLQQVKRT